MDGTDEHGSADWAAGYAESHQDWLEALGEVPNAPTSPSEAVERILRLEAEVELLRAQLRALPVNWPIRILALERETDYLREGLDLCARYLEG